MVFSLDDYSCTIPEILFLHAMGCTVSRGLTNEDSSRAAMKSSAFSVACLHLF